MLGDTITFDGTVREMPIIEILQKNITIYASMFSPSISIIVHNPTDQDIELLELKWKLFDINTGKLIDDNLNNEREEFSVASSGKYEYESEPNEEISEDRKYRMEIKLFSKGAEVKVIDKIDNVRIIKNNQEYLKDFV